MPLACGLLVVAVVLFAVFGPKPPPKPPPPVLAEPWVTYAWRSKGGRVIRMRVPKRVGTPKFGGPWAVDDTVDEEAKQPQRAPAANVQPTGAKSAAAAALGDGELL